MLFKKELVTRIHNHLLAIVEVCHGCELRNKTREYFLKNQIQPIKLIWLLNFDIYNPFLVRSLVHFNKFSWVLQGRVAHFLGHNAVFFTMLCTYMLTCHKINNISNLWLKLSTWIKRHLYKNNNIIYAPWKYIILNFWNWKTWTKFVIMHFLIHAFLCMVLFEIFYGDSIYDILKQ